MDEAIPARTRLGGLGALATAIVLAAVAGIPGAVVGVAVVLTWALLADVVALAVTTVAVGALLSADAVVVLGPAVAGAVPALDRASDVTGVARPVLASLGAVAFACLPLLLGSTADTERPVVVAIVTVAFTVALATIALVPLMAGETVLVGAGTLAAVVAVASYGLHRYGLLVAGVLQHG